MPLVKLCAWFGVPRRTVCYKPTKAALAIDPRFAEPIKAMIEENPSFGYRTVAFLPGFNKNTVQRIFQLKNCKRRLRRTCFQLAGLKFQGSRSSIFACGWPAATASRVALR